MIPKIIHLCWLSGDDYPNSIQMCLDSWKKELSDYEIWLWDKNRFDINNTIWTRQAFETKKYAFAADYIRLYALYHYGGIYLDSDVFVYKSFNDLLDLPYFIGEDKTHCFEPAIIGCEPGMPWIKKVLSRYDNLNFINPNGSYNMMGLPVVFYKQLNKDYTFIKLEGKENYNYEESIIKIFPSDFFNSRDYIGSIKTKNSYCTHNYIGSWMKKKKNRYYLIKTLIPRCLLNIIYHMYYNFPIIGKVIMHKIPYKQKECL